MVEDVVPIQVVYALTDDDPTDVVPIQIPVREGLHHDKVLRCAELHTGSRLHLNHDSPLDSPFFEGEGSQSNVDPNAISRPQQEDPVLQCKVTGSFDARFIVGQPFINKGFLIPKSGQKGEIKIHCEARFSPMKYGDTTDDAELPLTTITELLQLDRQSC